MVWVKLQLRVVATAIHKCAERSRAQLQLQLPPSAAAPKLGQDDRPTNDSCNLAIAGTLLRDNEADSSPMTVVSTVTARARNVKNDADDADDADDGGMSPESKQ